MSTQSSLSSNETSNFTEAANGSYSDEEFKKYDEPSLDDWPYFDLHGYGHWSTVLAIAIIGTIGNIFQFIMMSDSKLCSLSYSVYLKFLAVSDSLVLSEALFQQTQIRFNLPMVVDMNNALCKIVVGYQVFAMLLSPWLVVGLTLDRFVCVCFPLTRGRFCTMKKAIAVCSSMIAATIVLIIPNLVLTNLKYNRCLPSAKIIYYFMFVRLVVSTLVPCAVILTLNIAIIARIKRSNEFRNTFIKNKADSTKDNSTRPLVLISVLAFVTLLPIATSDAIAALFFVFLKTGRRAALLSLKLWPAFHIFYLLNFGQNFFILMASSQNYRQIMKSKLRCFSLKMKQTRYNVPAPSVGSTVNTDDISLSVITSNTIRSEMTDP
ncbi:probable G-protein coupled receptor 139 [Gigantopelta aegis]|uniref:probable G-protein coupled receptor 139 n=1 Tax=Gigantopelta aegis TaxID=1735272 RepID=UPI001B889EA5|nr:probable G-protein coupled receptor 139 [Gigantopelta aegis]